MPPKVEIIIPVYNRAHLVQSAIESALRQSYDNLAVLIIDDGSTDNTASVLSAYSGIARVRTIRHQRNRGVTAAKNTGLENLASDTDYFGILDSDDELTPGAVQMLMAEFTRLNESVSQVFGFCADPTTGQTAGRFERGYGFVTYEDALCGRFGGEFWHLISKSLLRGRRFEERAAGGESSVWHPLLKVAPGYVVTTVVRLYDQSGADRVSLERYDAATSRKKMWAYLAYLNSVGPDLRTICPQRHAMFTLEAAKWAVLAGERRVATTLLADTKISRQWLKMLMQFLTPLPVLRYIRQSRNTSRRHRH